jgi:hypothetical protein
MRIDRGNRSTRRKPAKVPLCQPQIPHDLIWTRTQAPAVGSRQLTVLPTARPLSLLCLQLSLPCDRYQQCPLLPCFRSYRLTPAPQLTHCSNCPGYNISHRKHRSFVAVQLLVSGPCREHYSSVVWGPLASNARGRRLATVQHTTVLF